MTEFLFYFSLLAVFYVYAGYPSLVFLAGYLFNKKLKKDNITPPVTILIAAFNEERCIEKTIQNKLSLDYPMDRREIVVISDGSTDRTDEIVRKYSGQGVKLITQLPRAGKTSALNLAVPSATGEILLFSDANSIWAPDSLRNLVRNFNDPAIGYVTGHMIYANPDGTLVGDGCSAYMKYENFLRKNETRIGSIVGVDGGIDAVRKKLYRPMNPDQLPDFVLPLSVAEQGFRVIYEPEAILREDSLKESKDEYRMRVRVSLRALWALFDKRQFLFDTDNIIYSWQIWSHKVLRYTCFLFLIIAYLSNLTLCQEGKSFQLFFFIQNFTYLVASITPELKKFGINLKIFNFVNYFVLLNLAASHAFVKFLMGQKQALWTPRKG